MLTIQSKTAVARGSQQQVFDYVSDFRNFSGLLPREKLDDLEITRESIRFNLGGVGRVGLMIRDKVPWSEITITATKDSAADFTFVIRISEYGTGRSEVKMDLQAKLNLFLEMLAREPLQQFADLVVDKLSGVEFP